MHEELLTPYTLRWPDGVFPLGGDTLALGEFATRFDVVIFVCGKKSSNGRVLFNVCRASNERCYNIEEESELQAEWFEGCASVGICGATSTPAWLMARVAKAIEERF